MSCNAGIAYIVEYQCNKCSKIRVEHVSPAMQKQTVNEQGYVEYVDVHQCNNSELKANILFVDINCCVRSQVNIESDEDEVKKTTLSSGFSIPAPKKTELVRIPILPTNDFGSFNVKGFLIKDKLRQCAYTLNEDADGEQLTVVSPLNFIEITVVIAREIVPMVDEKWIEEVVRILESIVWLDESTLSFLGIYLDHFITLRPKERELKELDLLLHSPIALPQATEEHADLLDEGWQSMFPDLNLAGYRLYRSIIRACVNNVDNCLLTLYIEVGLKYQFPYFLSAVSDMAVKGILKLDKLEFITVKDPNKEKEQLSRHHK